MAAESGDGFAAYVEALSPALGHADRRGPFRGIYTPHAPADPRAVRRLGHGRGRLRGPVGTARGQGGDAAKLKSRESADDFVTVLKVAGSTASTHDVQLAEQRWIHKLKSVEMGLNGPEDQSI